MADFRSDNTAGAAVEIMAALTAANGGQSTPYGDDALTRQVRTQLSKIFECDVEIGLVATGTAANCLGLALLCPPYGAVFCHEGAHIATDECGAPEMYTAGAKLIGLPGTDGKLTASQLQALLPGTLGVVHNVQPTALSLTQATECGTVYQPGEISALATVAHAHGLRVHMDGARFANAVVGTSASPADLTWRSGVDVLSFGATKNGALAAEAVILFDPALMREFGFRRKRAGQLWSKHRFLAAQMAAYLQDDLWLRHARHANAMASRLAAGLTAVRGVELMHPVQANEVFVSMPESAILALAGAGHLFYRWPFDHSCAIRLVTAFNTQPGDVDALLESLRRLN